MDLELCLPDETTLYISLELKQYLKQVIIIDYVCMHVCYFSNLYMYMYDFSVRREFKVILQYPFFSSSAAANSLFASDSHSNARTRISSVS